MDKFMEFMEKHFLPIAGKIGAQKHLVAIRDAFISIMPITMVGSIAVLLNVFLRDLPTTWGWTDFVATMQPVIDINGAVYFGSIAILALCFVFALGYNIAKAYDVNAIAGGVIAFASLVVCMSQTTNFDFILEGVKGSDVNALKDLGLNVSYLKDTKQVALMGIQQWGYININYCNANGLFTALTVGLLSSIVYSKLMLKKITIKLPDSVPPAVSKAFAAIIPGVVSIYLVAIIGYLVHNFTGLYVNDWILEFIQKPLLGLSQGFVSIILITFLQQLLWFFGLHGANVTAPITEGVYGTALNANIDMFNKTHDVSKLEYLWTRSSFDAYCMMGGSGVTLGLLIAIFAFSKRDDSKAIAKLSAPMGIFNINEPVVFGLPIVLNPIYIIPWLLVPPILASVAYAATLAGLVPPTFVAVPWVMPVGIYAFLATGGSIAAALLALFNLFLSFVIWTPFVLLANKQKDKEVVEKDVEIVVEENVEVVENKDVNTDDEWSFE